MNPGPDIHHIALQVSNLEKSLQFYRDILEFPLIKTQYDEENLPRSYWLGLTESILMLEKSKNWQAVTSPLIAFKIKAEQRNYWQKKLHQHKIIITKETDFTLYFNDPEGQALALSHYPNAPAPLFLRGEPKAGG